MILNQKKLLYYIKKVALATFYQFILKLNDETKFLNQFLIFVIKDIFKISLNKHSLIKSIIVQIIYIKTKVKRIFINIEYPKGILESIPINL